MSEPVNVRILEREYTVGVGPGEREQLEAAARLLDARMREIRGNNRTVAVDRVAVLAALNLASELLQVRRGGEERDQALNQSLHQLNRRLDDLFDSAR